jgi:hypothetical protein
MASLLTRFEDMGGGSVFSCLRAGEVDRGRFTAVVVGGGPLLESGCSKTTIWLFFAFDPGLPTSPKMATGTADEMPWSA